MHVFICFSVCLILPYYHFVVKPSIGIDLKIELWSPLWRCPTRNSSILPPCGRCGLHALFFTFIINNSEWMESYYSRPALSRLWICSCAFLSTDCAVASVTFCTLWNERLCFSSSALSPLLAPSHPFFSFWACFFHFCLSYASSQLAWLTSSFSSFTFQQPPISIYLFFPSKGHAGLSLVPLALPLSSGDGGGSERGQPWKTQMKERRRRNKQANKCPQ